MMQKTTEMTTEEMAHTITRKHTRANMNGGGRNIVQTSTNQQQQEKQVISDQCAYHGKPVPQLTY
jgi:hypothetical protein